jgi:hypothetical protein
MDRRKHLDHDPEPGVRSACDTGKIELDDPHRQPRENEAIDLAQQRTVVRLEGVRSGWSATKRRGNSNSRRARGERAALPSARSHRDTETCGVGRAPSCSSTSCNFPRNSSQEYECGRFCSENRKSCADQLAWTGTGESARVTPAANSSTRQHGRCRKIRRSLAAGERLPFTVASSGRATSARQHAARLSALQRLHESSSPSMDVVIA